MATAEGVPEEPWREKSPQNILASLWWLFPACNKANPRMYTFKELPLRSMI